MKDDEVTFVHEHKTHHFLISPELKVPRARDVYTVACHNSRDNVIYLIKHWKDFLQPNLSVLFVNVRRNKSWQVIPKLHDSIADPASLKTGLMTMFYEVPEV